ncbi:hypothetical protein ACFE04_016748 [Oxalis oulophora]
MDCPGCENKVKTALQKIKGVDNVDIDIVQQKVTVTGWADQKKVLRKVRKTGRRAELWQLPYNQGQGNYIETMHQCNGPVNYHGPQPTSSYNYYKHGYDTHDPAAAYYRHPAAAGQSSIFGQQTGSAFSDDNPHACSIM